MANPTQTEIASDYVKHALELIRVANGLRAAASAKIRAMALKIRLLLLGEDLTSLSFPALKRIVTAADEIAFTTFNELEASQASTVSELIRTEAVWAAMKGNYTADASETAILQQIRNFTVSGSTLSEQFDQIANNFHANMLRQVRMGADANQTDRAIAARIVGQGPLMAEGVAGSALRDVTGAIDAQVHGAADAGRRLAMQAGGVSALQWHAVLDPKVCPTCGERADLFWTIDGKPIGHNIPYISIPAHPWCRCIYLPQVIPEGRVLNLKPKNTFLNFLNTLSQAEQDDILGNGRAQMWRDGKITLQDLIGQNGMTMTLGQLTARYAKRAG